MAKRLHVKQKAPAHYMLPAPALRALVDDAPKPWCIWAFTCPTSNGVRRAIWNQQSSTGFEQKWMEQICLDEWAYHPPEKKLDILRGRLKISPSAFPPSPQRFPHPLPSPMLLSCERHVFFTCVCALCPTTLERGRGESTWWQTHNLCFCCGPSATTSVKTHTCTIDPKHNELQNKSQTQIWDLEFSTREIRKTIHR